MFSNRIDDIPGTLFFLLFVEGVAASSWSLEGVLWWWLEEMAGSCLERGFSRI